MFEEAEPGGGQTSLEARCTHSSQDTPGLPLHLHLIPTLSDSYSPSSITLREPSAGGIVMQCNCLLASESYIFASENK